MTTAPITPPARIAFIGLGQMGLPMARNLAAKGYRLAVHDREAQAIARARAAFSCDGADSLAALARGADAVITMLPDGHSVREVLLGADGLVEGCAQGTLVIDMSSSSPIGTRALGTELAARGIGLVDAPVSGGVRKAVDGSLSIMAGTNDAALLAHCRPVLEAMGAKIFPTGPLGSGHAMKALNNYVSAAGLAAAAEAVLAGQRFGLAAATVVDILNASTGMNNSTQVKFHQFILSRAFNSGFSLDLMVKDLGAALEVAQATRTPVPLAEACVKTWRDAQAALGRGVDHTAVARYWEQLAGEELGSRK